MLRLRSDAITGANSLHDNAVVAAQQSEPETLRLFEMRVNLIPFYGQGVRARLEALKISEKYHPLDGIEIRVDGVEDPIQSTILAVYTQAASCMAAIYSRLLLEFLGLKVAGTPSQLLPIVRRTRQGDIGIENFRKEDGSALAKALPSAVESFPDPRRVEQAWITVCDFAGQRLAHATNDLKLNGADVTPMMMLTFETVPQLVSSVFYDQLE